MTISHGAGVTIYAKATGRILWLRRAPGSDFAGYWCCPGGGVEDFETIEQGVFRECQEEMGLTPDMELIHMARVSPAPDYVYHNHVGIVEQEFVPVLNNEHTEYIWSAKPPEPVHPGLKKAMSIMLSRTTGAGDAP